MRQAGRAFGVLLALSAGPAAVGDAQDSPPRLPPDTLRLDELGAFRDPPSNWRIVGSATAEPGGPPELQTGPGRGVLANVAPAREGDDLFTEWEHGDLELKLDFMMAEGSNSGVYLQGRYEIQLFDSWGKAQTTFSDAGGIYQRWNPARGEGRQGFEGHPPRVNASRAPGLWQNLHIVFRAPRFDARGRKTENARFVRVVHNGVVIHENVEVTGPTRAAAFEAEAPTGPLMLQGDHGPVAFRDILYRRYNPARVRLSQLRFRAYEGEFTVTDEFGSGEAVSSGDAPTLDPTLVGRDDRFGAVYEGVIEVPRSGDYLFDLRLGWVDPEGDPRPNIPGGARLMVAGREVLVHGGDVKRATGVLELPAGRHPFDLRFFKTRGGRDPRVELTVDGPGMKPQALHDESAIPARPEPGPIQVAAAPSPVVQRGFLRHGEQKRTHVAAVGDPLGVHYAYDLSRGAPLMAWRGPFAEATAMWHQRGSEQLLIPLGSTLELPGAPTLAVLRDRNAPWPDSATAADLFRLRGYALDSEGRPEFRYEVGGARVRDKLTPLDGRRGLRREITLAADQGTRMVHGELYARLAAGESIRRESPARYVIGDRAFYMELEDPSGAFIRRTADGEELLVPLELGGRPAVAYSIIW